MSRAQEGTEYLAEKEHTVHWDSFEEHVGCRQGDNLWLSFHI